MSELLNNPDSDVIYFGTITLIFIELSIDESPKYDEPKVAVILVPPSSINKYVFSDV